MNHAERMAIRARARQRIVSHAPAPVIDPDDVAPTEYRAAAPAVLAFIVANPGKTTVTVGLGAGVTAKVARMTVAFLEIEGMAFWNKRLRGWKAAEKG